MSLLHKTKKYFSQKFINILLNYFPKSNKRVIIIEPTSIYSNTVALANYLAKNSKKKVYFIVPKQMTESAKGMVVNNVHVLHKKCRKYIYFIFPTTKYIFKSMGRFNYSKNQISINMWHGIPYKKIGMSKDNKSRNATITVATSPLTKLIFANAFKVPLESVFISGYPRNDILLRTHRKKKYWKQKIANNLNNYSKIIVWLPTWRKTFLINLKSDGKDAGNPFQVENFDVYKFNKILKSQNALCIVKPHPLSQQEKSPNLTNVHFINDKWLWNQGITIYHLLACSDVLISDVSSVIIDYLLIDQPIICLSTDFEDYKTNRGFVFDNIEDWMPSNILKTTDEFFISLKKILKNDSDEFGDKRKRLRDLFFTYQDENSAKRLIHQVFKN